MVFVKVSTCLVVCSLYLLQTSYAGETEFGAFPSEMGGGLGGGEMGGGMGGALGEGMGLGGEGGGMGGGEGATGEGGPLAELMKILGPEGMCKQISDCPCGSYCVSGENTTCTLGSSDEEDCTCKPGCVLFDKYLASKEPTEIYGRTCECGDYLPFVRGRVIWCQKGEWVDQPVDQEITQWNPNCIFRVF